jgi:hypothetical protein
VTIRCELRATQIDEDRAAVRIYFSGGGAAESFAGELTMSVGELQLFGVALDLGAERTRGHLEFRWTGYLSGDGSPARSALIVDSPDAGRGGLPAGRRAVQRFELESDAPLYLLEAAARAVRDARAKARGWWNVELGRVWMAGQLWQDLEDAALAAGVITQRASDGERARLLMGMPVELTNGPYWDQPRERGGFDPAADLLISLDEHAPAREVRQADPAGAGGSLTVVEPAPPPPRAEGLQVAEGRELLRRLVRALEVAIRRPHAVNVVYLQAEHLRGINEVVRDARQWLKTQPEGASGPENLGQQTLPGGAPRETVLDVESERKGLPGGPPRVLPEGRRS